MEDVVNSKIRDFVEIIRPYNMLSRVLIFSIGFFWINNNNGIWGDYFIGILVLILGFAFATIQNDIEDLPIDRINSPDKALASGRLHLQEAINFNYIILISLLALSLYHFPHHIVPVLIMLSVSWLYNKPPFILSRKPFMALIILGLMYSTVPLLYGYYLRNGEYFGVSFLYLIICWFFLRVSIVLLKDFKDSKGDREYGKKSFYSSFGTARTIWVSMIFFCLSSVGIMSILFYSKKLGILAILPALFILKDFYVRSKLFRAPSTKELTGLFYKIYLGQNQFDVTFLLCLIFLK